MATGYDQSFYGKPMSDIAQSAMETAKYMEAWQNEREQRQNERAVANILANAKGDFDAADKAGIRQYLSADQQLTWQKTLDAKRLEREQRTAMQGAAESLFPYQEVGPTVGNGEIQAQRNLFTSLPQMPEVAQKAVTAKMFPEPVKPEKPQDRYKAIGANVFDTETQEWITPPAAEKPPEYMSIPKPLMVDGVPFQVMVNKNDPSDVQYIGEVQSDEKGNLTQRVKETKGGIEKDYLVMLTPEGVETGRTLLGTSELPSDKAGKDEWYTKGAASDALIALRKKAESISGMQRARMKYKSEYVTYASRGEGWMNKVMQKAQANPESLTGQEKGFYEFQIENMRNFNSYRSMITGAAAAMAELNWLLESFPQGKMSKEQYEAAIDVMEQALKDDYELTLKAYKERRPLEYDEIINHTSKNAEERAFKKYGITEDAVSKVMAATGQSRESAINYMVTRALEKQYGKR